MNKVQMKIRRVISLAAVIAASGLYLWANSGGGGHGGGHGHAGGHAGGVGHAGGHAGHSGAGVGGHHSSYTHGGSSHGESWGHPSHGLVSHGVDVRGHHVPAHYDHDFHGLDHHHTGFNHGFPVHHDLDHHHFDHHHHLIFGYPFSYYPSYYGSPYAYGTYGYDYAYSGAVDYGLIDLDIQPEYAEIYLDGEYVGIADDFDGSPDYLRVPPGPHTIEFVLEGYATSRVDLDARPGSSLRVTRTLRSRPAGVPRYDTRDDEPQALPPERRDHSSVQMTSAATIELRLDPPDTAVYLDGKRQADAGIAPIPARPGRRTLEVVRPGYRSFRKVIDVPGGRTFSLNIRLEAGDE